MSESSFRQPSAQHDESGNLRTVGFEIEFTRVSLADAIAAVEREYSSARKNATAAACDLEIDGLGTFGIELDWEFLKQQAEATGGDLPEDWVGLLSQAAELVVPVEVVCPPIPLNRLDELLPLTRALREAGAEGTASSLIAAYGVHINPRSPALDSATLWHYLRAFSLLQWWLVKAHEVDLT
ncbi:MAG: amidoligase family protein, partial [Chromatocurvus sp.]